MKQELLNKNYRIYKEELEGQFQSILPLTDNLDLVELKREYKQLIESLESPFMFVIIGEVKAGKSSFINALTGENICAVDADICTDKVQQLIYSEQEYNHSENKYLETVGKNIDILKEISIVDTPGTDSIIAEHEQITRRFAPNSNLIFFVFPALNPHHNSSWEMLASMKERWSRNVIFIATQADRCTEKELEINRKKIGQYASERGFPDPIIFTTSSLWEEEGKTEKSGFNSVREYMANTRRGGAHLILKLKDRLHIGEILIEQLKEEITRRAQLLKDDKTVESLIDEKQREGKNQSSKEIDKILKRISYVYEKTGGEYEARLKKSLSTSSMIKRVLPSLHRKESGSRLDKAFFQKLIDELKEKLEEDLAREAQEKASFFLDGIKYRFSELIRQVDNLRAIRDNEKNQRALSSFDSRREEILEELLRGLRTMREDENLIPRLEKHNPQIGDTFLKGGAIAAAGAVLTLITQGALLDATGGILSAAGILGATGVIFFKKRKVIKEFSSNIRRSQDLFQEELKSRFQKRLDILTCEIGRLFEELSSHIEREERTLEKVDSTVENHHLALLKIKREINRL